ncbi:MAG: 4-(cytidine 5'-diphospho)-2-C-methyl-D-erythritol kinase [Acidobacteriota bacterium]|nr:4-(cytidine 5'-diphospho)-2-C-methyl-D-erythritol kinase [Acidobacteriota bacterium]
MSIRRAAAQNRNRKQTDPIVKIRAHAKINLDLRVAAKGADGFHDLRTVLQSIALHDTLTLRVSDGPCRVRCSTAGVPLDTDNLVWRAANGLWAELGHAGDVRGVTIGIRKRIPIAAGLGGGTSDAVAALQGLCRLWGTRLPAQRLVQLARQVGADGPFFLLGGTALGLGHGDELYPLVDTALPWVVVAVPPRGVSTPEAYRWLDHDRARRRRGHEPRRPRTPFVGGRVCADEVANDLQPPVMRRRPEIRRMVKLLRETGARMAAMTGSGSAVFGCFPGRAAARHAGRLVGRPGWTVHLTRTIDRDQLERQLFR